MPLPDRDLQTKADAAHDTFVSKLTRVQATYKASRTRYAQVLKTSEPPADGVKAAPDLTRKPHDQTQSAADLGITLGSSEVAHECHEYLGPSGAGYVAISSIVVDKATWVRATSVAGPEDRAHDWEQVSDNL